MENETYSVMVNLYKNEVNLDITIEEQREQSNDKDEDSGKKGLEGWAIALIILGAIILLTLIVVLLIIILRKKNKVSNKQIEEKIENLNEFKEMEI